MRKTKIKNRKVICFTLIELLLVISIIVILTAMLFPAIQKAREMGKKTVCMNQLKQSGISSNLYVSDNNGILAMVDNNGTGLPWTLLLYNNGYLKNKNIFACPSHVPETYDSFHTYQTYGMRDWRVSNSYIFSANNFYFLKFYNVTTPSTFYLHGDSSYDLAYTAHSAFKQSHVMSPVIASTTGGVHLRHGKTANLDFVDGHAKSSDSTELKNVGFTSGLSKSGLRITF